VNVTDDGEFDYLVVSDLHLRGGWEHRTQGLYYFDEEFAEFLRHYRMNPTSDRRWRLVIGGDLIEFLYLADPPDPQHPLLRGLTFSANEMRYGASSEARKSLWKLDTILRSSHPQLLIALSRFVAEGNHIAILRGNHDSELAWPEVQEQFRKLIAEHHPADTSYMAMKDVVRERVQFPQWFWYVPELLYFEHGCQYDRFCSFEHFLYPVVPTQPTRVERCISEFAIRYFSNQMKTIDAMAAENISSVSEYLRLAFGGGATNLAKILGLYGRMAWAILRRSGRPDPEAEQRVREEQERRVAAYDERFGLAAGTSAAVDALRERPVMRSRLATARFLILDLWAAGVVLLGTGLGLERYYSGGLILAGMLAVIGVLAYITVLRAQRIDSAAKLQTTAQRLQALFRVPFVVLGHSHKAGWWPIPGGGNYINVGTWASEQGGSFVYLQIETSTPPPRAALFRWNKQRQMPEPFTPPAAGTETVR